MATLKYRTKNEVNLKEKPRVYFTCHPDDFDKSFNKICEDILKTQDCIIYYKEDMTVSIPEQNRDIDIGRNNLIVVPVTFKLLTTPNYAMDEELVYAFSEHIPVLPIMMESGIDQFYAQPDKFGEIQYLNPYSNDATEISYNSKLERFLASVLISNELAKRVRAAFDAYIFLSYRKKDRNYANQLMQLIHSHPECRDIAIWYDEFLTPGESFKDNISKVLSDSKLFALLVTPNLLEEPDGRPNYVMAEEYPAAQQSGIEILPAEMENTDKEKLSEKYKGIPHCVDPHNDLALKTRLMESIFKIVRTANDDDPTHNFLIGLAYLEGIDVEINRPRALSLIEGAANTGLIEAMEKLREMYTNGVGVDRNYQAVVKWANEIATYYKKQYGLEHPDTIAELINLTSAYDMAGDYQSAMEVCLQSYELCLKVHSENESGSNIIELKIASMLKLASIYGNLGIWKKSLEYNQKAYEFSCEALGEEDELTMAAANNLAIAYVRSGKKHEALCSFERLFGISCKVYGIKDAATLTAMNNLAMTYNEIGDHTKAVEIIQDCHKYRLETLGEKHPDTIATLGNWAVCLGDAKQYTAALSKVRDAYEQILQLYGEDHPDTLLAKFNLAMVHYYAKEYDEAMIYMEPVYIARVGLFGKRHKDVRDARENLAVIYDKKSTKCLMHFKLIKFVKYRFLSYKTLLGL